MADLLHVLNRGVDGRTLFQDSSDYVRFVHNLYEFNDDSPAQESVRRSNPDSGNVGHRKSHMSAKGNQRKLLVHIHGWCLMKNHYHLLLSERIENGVSLFMRKLNIGYAKYFNERYDRVGTLFQGRTKKIPISRDAHFLYILHYIHLNPLDYVNGAEEWRFRSKSGIRDLRTALASLNEYRWSSFLDYSGKQNFPSLLTKSLFSNAPGDYSKALKEYLSDATNAELNDPSLE